MGKHTPGIRHHFTIRLDDHFIEHRVKSVSHAGEMEVARCGCDDFSFHDAQIIAAAPELLEALRNSVSLVVALSTPNNEVAEASIEESLRAIAKAKGESHE